MAVSAKARVQQWLTFGQRWWIYDAYKQCPVYSAPRLAIVLEGKHKPIYHPLSDCGDHIVVINCKDVALEGELFRTKTFFSHSGYAGGKKRTLAWELHKKDPTMLFYKGVYSRLKSNLLRRTYVKRLHLFPDKDVPAELLANVSGQIRQVFPVPKRLDQYTDEEIRSFPRVVRLPEDYTPDEGDVDPNKPYTEKYDWLY